MIVLDVGSQQLRADDGDQLVGGWQDRDFPYLVVDQALPDVLREFGHNLDLPIDISPKIKGRVRQYEHDGSAGRFLDYLVAEHRLDWIVDRGRLYISSVDEQIARSWPGSADVFESARTALANAGLGDSRYDVGFDGGASTISLLAPPRYMALASPVIERVLKPSAARTVNVIHGRSRTGGT